MKNSNYKVNTFISRIRALWNHIRLSRERFEAIPDKGLFGKGVQRLLNKFWNYIIIGLFGTTLIIAVNPAVCILSSLTSLALCVTIPIW